MSNFKKLSRAEMSKIGGGTDPFCDHTYWCFVWDSFSSTQKVGPYCGDDEHAHCQCYAAQYDYGAMDGSGIGDPNQCINTVG